MFGGKETLTDFGILNVMGDDFSLNYNTESGLVSVSTKSVVIGSRIPRTVTRDICTVGEDGSCN